MKPMRELSSAEVSATSFEPQMFHSPDRGRLRSAWSLGRVLLCVLGVVVAGCSGGSGPGGGKRAGGFSRGKDDDPPPAPAPAAPVGEASRVKPQRAPRVGGARATNLPEGQSGIQLDCAGPVRTTQFFLRRHPGAEGQPTVIVLTSSRQQEGLEFPSVFFRAELPAETADNLVGHTLKGRLFVQPDANGPVYFSPGSAAQIQINAMDADAVEGEVFESQLSSTDGTRRVVVSGAFTASLREGLKRRVRHPSPNQEDL